jgi:NitT/TauT family transport system ATP-binding protein
MAFRCIEISKTYLTHNGEVTALQAVDFNVNEREFVCIVGPSGCGKTTLLKIIAGLLEPSNGQIIFSENGGDSRLHSAMVFQEQGLFPWMSVQDNVAFGLETQGVPMKKRRKMAQDFLTKVGLNEFMLNFPHELSGGMRQRVAILRAFLANPQILLMDEPFGSLDSQTRYVMQEELLRIWREHRKTVIYVTHDIEEAILLGDRVLVMSGRPGRIQKEIPISIERPRQLANRDNQEMAEIRWQIWKMLEDEVRKDLSILV